MLHWQVIIALAVSDMKEQRETIRMINKQIWCMADVNGVTSVGWFACMYESVTVCGHLVTSVTFTVTRLTQTKPTMAEGNSEFKAITDRVIEKKIGR